MERAAQLKKKIEQTFFTLGFNEEMVGGKRCLVYGSTYCMLTYIDYFRAFVIEWAGSRGEAEKNMFEDGDLFFLEDPDETILRAVQKEILAERK